jgi:tetratricopeptide (TPR) repeat protein
MGNWQFISLASFRPAFAALIRFPPRSAGFHGRRAAQSVSSYDSINDLVQPRREGESMINPLRVLLALILLPPSAVIGAAQSRADSAQSYVARGAAWFKKGEIERAINDYNLALAFDPRSVTAWFNRAVARTRKGDLEGAFDDFTKVLELDPWLSEAWNEIGNLLAEKGDLKGAIAAFDRAIELERGRAAYFNNRGRAFLADGELQKAANDLERALTLDPKLPEAWAHRGIIRAEKQDYARAIADFDRALKLNPRLANTWANRGLALMMQGRIEEGRQSLSRYRELGGKGNPAAEELLRELRGPRK